MNERFEISKDKKLIFDNMTDDFLDIEDACTLLNNFSNYLIYPITICKDFDLFKDFDWEMIADEIKDGYEDLKRAKEQGKDRNEKTGHIIVIQFEKDMKI